MTIFIHKLQTVTISPAMKISVAEPVQSESLTPDSPAILAMTDLTSVRAVTIEPGKSIDFADELMRHAGIRMLVVSDKAGVLLGLVTARDIIGEKPIKIMTSEKLTREQINVHHVMTPLSELNPFDYSDIVQVTVKQVIECLRDAGRQHAIVIEKHSGDMTYVVRGMFSITQIGRLLGMDISPDGHVQSFAEFEQLIA